MMPQYFTPPLGPGLTDPQTPADEAAWRRRVTVFLNSLHDTIDKDLEAYIGHQEQLASGIVGTAQLQAGAVDFTALAMHATLSTAVSILSGLNTSVSWTFAPQLSRQPMVMGVCTAAGWFVSVQYATTAGIGLNVLNQSGSTATVTIYAAYH